MSEKKAVLSPAAVESKKLCYVDFWTFSFYDWNSEALFNAEAIDTTDHVLSGFMLF